MAKVPEDPTKSSKYRLQKCSPMDIVEQTEVATVVVVEKCYRSACAALL